MSTTTTPDHMREILRGLRSIHKLRGIRPHNADPDTEASLLREATLPAFQDALGGAEQYWPDCQSWDLIGSDGYAQPNLGGLPIDITAPDGFGWLDQPDLLHTFPGLSTT